MRNETQTHYDRNFDQSSLETSVNAQDRRKAAELSPKKIFGMSAAALALVAGAAGVEHVQENKVESRNEQVATYTAALREGIDETSLLPISPDDPDAIGAITIHEGNGILSEAQEITKIPSGELMEDFLASAKVHGTVHEGDTFVLTVHESDELAGMEAPESVENEELILVQPMANEAQPDSGE